jgi:hypothetical protein
MDCVLGLCWCEHHKKGLSGAPANAPALEELEQPMAGLDQDPNSKKRDNQVAESVWKIEGVWHLLNHRDHSLFRQ